MELRPVARLSSRRLLCTPSPSASRDWRTVSRPCDGTEANGPDRPETDSKPTEASESDRRRTGHQYHVERVTVLRVRDHRLRYSRNLPGELSPCRGSVQSPGSPSRRPSRPVTHVVREENSSVRDASAPVDVRSPHQHGAVLAGSVRGGGESGVPGACSASIVS